VSTTKVPSYAPPATGVAATARGLLAGPRTRPFVLIGVVLVIFSLVRVLTGADELTSAGTLEAALALSIPLGLAGLGGLWSERAGVVNIGLEGMMIMGTWGAGWAGSVYGPWQGLVVGVAFGAFGGLMHAVATVTFGVDHIVSGVAINLLGVGITQFLAVQVLHNPTQSGEIPSMGTFTVPWLPGWLESVSSHQWFLVSDVANVVYAIVDKPAYFTIIAIALLPITYVVLWRTAFGLRLRSCGEAPYAAETLGVNVYKYKYLAVIASGALAGFGGSFLAIWSGFYHDGQTQGYGFIGLAAMIFGNWRPAGLAVGAGLFGYTNGLQLRSPPAVHALLLVLVIALAAYSAWLLYRKHWVSGGVSVVCTGLVLWWFLDTKQLDQHIVSATPYVTTLLVLALASQRLRPPAADGLPYRRGQGR
jgi:general nucleoside transport system permease protein